MSGKIMSQQNNVVSTVTMEIDLQFISIVTVAMRQKDNIVNTVTMATDKPLGYVSYLGNVQTYSALQGQGHGSLHSPY